jgi:hypothetical protein
MCRNVINNSRCSYQCDKSYCPLLERKLLSIRKKLVCARMLQFAHICTLLSIWYDPITAQQVTIRTTCFNICPQGVYLYDVYVYFLRFSQIATVSLNIINRLVSVAETKCVSYKVRTIFLYCHVFSNPVRTARVEAS